MRKFLAICFLFISFSSFGQAKRALSLIDKQKYEAAFNLLDNGFDKDTSSASIPFVLSTLYLVDSWPRINLDSAHYFSLVSIKNYDRLTEKSLDKHIKDGFGKTRLLIQKKKIDSLAFDVAKSGGTESDYQKFINEHKGALELDSAIILRNTQAFLLATNKNTLQSYEFFLKSYKNAIEWQRADEVYQHKLYFERTSSGKLKEYLIFEKEHPNSPFYENCAFGIYDIIAGKNNIETLLSFVDSYPNTRASQKAIGLLYHLHIEQEPASLFADKFPLITVSDSLQKVINQQEVALIPIWKNNYLQLADIRNTIKVDSLSSVDFKSIDKDFSAVSKNGAQYLIGKNKEVFYTGEWQAIIDDLNGYIFLKTKAGVDVVHKNGTNFTIGEEASIVGSFISFKKNGLWGLKSVTNKPLISASYDSIWFENNLIFLKLKDKVSPNKLTGFYPGLDAEPITIGAFYDDYEWLTERIMWVVTGDMEALLSDSLSKVVPIAKHQIDLVQKGWSITKKNEVLVPEFGPSVLMSFDENSRWQLAKAGDSIIVKYNYTKSFTPDNAYLLGPSAIVMEWNDSTYVHISDTIRFYKPADCEVKPLLNQSNEAYYYEIIENKKKSLVNTNGDKIALPNFKKAVAFNASFFQLETAKGKSLYSSSGNLIIEKIEGASLINDTTISILKNQNFGLIIPEDSILIEPTYDQKITHLHDTIWIFSRDKKFGLMNLKNEEILASDYEQITYWTNGLVFLKKDLNWRIYDLKIEQIVEAGIIAYQSITKNSKSPVIKYQKGVGVGIFDSTKGTVLKPTYTSVHLEGTSAESYYRAEKYVEEAGLHILIYYGLDGKPMFQNIMSEEEYEVLFGAIE
jgi:WG repeat protein